MCGIVGAVALKQQSIDVRFAKPMADRIAHRGPDDAGYLFYHTGARHSRNIAFFQNFTDRQFRHIADLLPPIEGPSAQEELNSHDYDLFLGHRRLAILDPSPAGHQPMSDLTRSIWLAYNGEIYNFKDIRAELERLGHRFRTNTDTEVIVYAYIEWGIECIHRFNGMFAFALYDNFRKKLFLARDRYGIKPLYYFQAPDGNLLFASETKSILDYKGYEHSMDYEAILEYFTFQNIFTDRTFHKGIKLLESGHYLEVDLTSGRLSKTQFWDFDFTEPESVRDEREYIEELDRLFTQAVERQLVADVPVGSYLSGGMDSGSITAIAARKLPYINTFTVGFDLSSASGMELGFDERAKSEYMSYKFRTEHYEMVMKSGDMERCLPDFAYHLEEPRVGQSYPNYYAARLASRFVKVVLSGAGGDELFGGYPWRYFRAVNNQDFDDYITKYYKFWKRLIPNVLLNKVMAPISEHTKGVWTKDIFASVFKDQRAFNTPEEYIDHSLYFEAKTFLHGLLVVEDKLSMAHSLETRVPFLDNDLVDFAQRVPVRLKLGNLDKVTKMDENEIGKLKKTNDGKEILRKAMSRYIPEDIHRAVKQGFSSPDQAWFKGESIDFVRRKLLDRSASIYAFLDYSETAPIINEHLEGKQNRRLFIWSLLNFEEWLAVYGAG
ncbi:MAG: asparagine synthase (glutamine-hydrolyzing) [Leptospiraceae bacterium]|nr:asparagine synthase (glutamine-hydrolyzing) [Leptospiraceae bacterium]